LNKENGRRVILQSPKTIIIFRKSIRIDMFHPLFLYDRWEWFRFNAFSHELYLFAENATLYSSFQLRADFIFYERNTNASRARNKRIYRAFTLINILTFWWNELLLLYTNHHEFGDLALLLWAQWLLFDFSTSVHAVLACWMQSGVSSW